MSTLGLSRVSGRSERLCVLYLDEWEDTGRRETHHEVSLPQLGWAGLFRPELDLFRAAGTRKK